MKKILLAVILLFAFVCHAQTAVRFGDGQPVWKASAAGGALLSVSSASIAFCNAPASGLPCTNTATTYTDSTMAHACPSGQQVTVANSSTCQSSTDSFGNWGVWVAPSTTGYAYTVTIAGRSYGPYPTGPLGQVGFTVPTTASPNQVLVGPPYSGASALVQSKGTGRTGSGGSTAVPLTFDSPVAAGNLLVAVTLSNAFVSLANSTGQTWQQVSTTPSFGRDARIWYICSATGGVTTVTFTGSSQYDHLHVYEFSGTHPSTNCLDASVAADTSSGYSFTLGTPAQSNELYIAFAANGSNSSTVSASPGFTLGQYSSESSFSTNLATQFMSTASATATTFTMPLTGGCSGCGGVAASFKLAAGAGTPSFRALVASDLPSGVVPDTNCKPDGAGNLSCKTVAVGATNPTTIDSTGNVKPAVDDSVSIGSYVGGVFTRFVGWFSHLYAKWFRDEVDVKQFGAKGDGVTDDSAAVLAAITDRYNAHGGVVFFPRGTYLITQQIVMPNDGIGVTGPQPYSRQPDISFRGVGDVRNGQGQIPGSTYGGSVLKLTYCGTGWAKFETYGLGHVTMQALTLWDNSGCNLPFVHWTGTTMTFRDMSVLGSKALANADQDAFLAGGSNTTFTTINDPNAPNQGYETLIDNVYFNYIRRAVYARAWVQGLHMRDSFIGPQSGSNLTDGAAIEFDGTGGGGNGNSHFTDNRCEITGYYYCYKFLSSTSSDIRGTDVEDTLGAHNTAVAYFDSGSGYNYLQQSSRMTLPSIAVDLNGNNTIIDATAVGGMTQLYGTQHLWDLQAQGSFTLRPRQSATSSNNYHSPLQKFISTYWDGAATQDDNWQLNTIASASANPAIDFHLSHPSGSSGGGKFYLDTPYVFNSTGTISGDINFSGNYNFGTGGSYFNNNLWCRNQTAATSGSNPSGCQVNLFGYRWNGSSSTSYQWALYSSTIPSSGAATNIWLNLEYQSGGGLSAAVKMPGVYIAPVTVSALPTCNAANSAIRRTVSDATAPTYLGTLTGGGSVMTPVICNGTNWVSY